MDFSSCFGLQRAKLDEVGKMILVHESEFIFSVRTGLHVDEIYLDSLIEFRRYNWVGDLTFILNLGVLLTGQAKFQVGCYLLDSHVVVETV